MPESSEQIERKRFVPRPAQAEVLAYRGGKMGVSAVPGSGKTATLSYLAASLVANADLADDQEVLIVTLVKSAVGNFATSMRNYLQGEFDLLPYLGYRVRTLHGLANDIVHERPGLVGLSDAFTVLDERASDDILDEAVETWTRTNPDAADAFLNGEHFANQYTRNHHWPDTVKSVASAFIKQAKDMQITHDEAIERIQKHPQNLPLASICTTLYEQYERGLRYRGAVDFQDLIRLALRILQRDADYLARLRRRFPYILEDEAQDSSKLQEEILRLLAGEGGNWVRVGDPNQAIYETFTTANPRYLRDFMDEIDVKALALPNSGRNTQSIISLANALIDWSLRHPNAAIRSKQPLTEPHIEPTPAGDPQGNPPDDAQAVYLMGEKYTGDQEREAVIQSLKQWLPENGHRTCAVLLPINSSGAKMVQRLRAENIPYVENLRSTSGTRAIVGSLTRVLGYLEDPTNSQLLADVYRVWRRDDRGDEDAERSINNVAKVLRGVKTVEDYLYPRKSDWLEDTVEDDETMIAHLGQFRAMIQRWQAAVDLPIDQLVLTVGGDLFRLDTDIATAYSVALHLRRFHELHPEARMPEFTEELREIAKGNRNFNGMSDSEDTFDPDKHKGEVTVTTMHKAKGLEWDRVYIMSANNYIFPSDDPFDSFMSEKWFVRDGLNLEAEALAQLAALKEGSDYVPGQATKAARVEYAAERLRLLYVAITRARRELVITWNSGRNGDQIEARPAAYLRGWWAQQQEAES
ncbi:MAG: ATP-dependent helicase [Anaerolineaceae bacterium]|nr:ATP-dependent helicase [Anaerolineaceae bacterium]